LIQEVSTDSFREDLFYRLAVAILHIPPLRERPGDTGLLIDRFLEVINKECALEPGFEPKSLSPAARNLLIKHNYPGNVRELQNTLWRAAIWSNGKRIEAEDVRTSLTVKLQGSESAILALPLGNGFNLRELLGQVSKHYLKRALEESHGNKSMAAKLVGFPNYQTFDNWIKRHELGD
jgi:DNA-binding NtrC family response regulator